MSGLGEARPIVLRETRVEPLDAEQVTVRLLGERSESLPATVALVLAVRVDGESHNFPLIPQPRQTVGADAHAFDASFLVPVALVPELADGMVLQVGELELPVPPPARSEVAPPPAVPLEGRPLVLGAPAPAGDPLRAELAVRARSEARLRAELAEVRARLEARESAGARIESLTSELAAEIEKLRGVAGTEAERRRDVESRSMVLAAELTAVQAERDEARDERDEARTERDGARAEADALHAEDESRRAELEALREEIDRLGAARGVEVESSDGAQSELERAEALLAEARALRSSLE
jgi:hypothetical protein